MRPYRLEIMVEDNPALIRRFNYHPSTEELVRALVHLTDHPNALIVYSEQIDGGLTITTKETAWAMVTRWAGYPL